MEPPYYLHKQLLMGLQLPGTCFEKLCEEWHENGGRERLLKGMRHTTHKQLLVTSGILFATECTDDTLPYHD